MIGRSASRLFSTAEKQKASKEAPLFDKIMIANRGEISIRVARTARRLGIKSVAVYSDADANAPHVRYADEAYCVGPAASSMSYLNVPRILKAIEETGTQAVHPGYGFLSENGGFSRILEERNVKFIGPRAHAIDAMGDKIESKLLAEKAGVNIIPGFMGTVVDAEDAVRIAKDIGYPVMIKASAGGGGKGMRIAWNDDDVRMGYRLSKEEAKSSFGDDRLFVEKFIEEPRHIEIQIVADKYGNVATFPERECSIQRRNQKVIEESPSVLLDAATRSAMQAQAAQLARAVDYESAGTLEFLVDKHKNFYFLEMNTRLQVEHPVTELVSGEDLVELMIKVAAGHELPKHLLEPIPIIGHAMEARVYAEDPFRGFLPSTGKLTRYSEPVFPYNPLLALPESNPADISKYILPPYAVVDKAQLAESHVLPRCDAGVTEGSDISMFYDPMICKLITHGKTRDESIQRLSHALDLYVIRGVNHNVPFIQDLLRAPRFQSGNITTGYIAEEYPDGFHGVQLTPLELKTAILGATAFLDPSCIDVTGPDDLAVEVTVVGGKKQFFSVSGHRGGDFTVVDDESGEVSSLYASLAELSASVENGQGHLEPIEQYTENYVNIAHKTDNLIVLQDSSNTLAAVQVESMAGNHMRVLFRGAQIDLVFRTLRDIACGVHMKPKVKRDMSNLVVAPMPGTLISVNVKPGDVVENGQEVAVMEAMKMQNVLRSPKKGTVKAVHFKPQDTLKVDEVILEFEKE